jgi:DNA replication protein DnaC
VSQPMSPTDVEARARDIALDAVTSLRRELGCPLFTREQDEWTCPRCGETKHREPDAIRFDPCTCIVTAERDAYTASHASLWEHAYHQHVHRAAVPKRYLAASLDSFIARPGAERALAACREWVGTYSRDSDRGLFLTGGYGSGKTHLAIGCLKGALRKALPLARYISVSSMLADYAKGAGDRYTNHAVIEDAARAEVLVMDDLGQEVPTDRVRGLLFEVIDTRYREGRPSIVTSNFSDAALADRIGGAVVSRLYETCRGLRLTAPDYRKAA